jgi:iron complex outermembrane recepter protein
MKRNRSLPAFALALMALPSLAQQLRPQDLADASLEQLMNIQVTSAGKKAQSLRTTAASAYVISAEDIRRSGMQSLPELLRLAPGVQVARLESGAWAISIRGFSDQYADKLLVLVDGRSVYNEAYGGVFWEMQEMAVADIERIEVIRGPAAAMWGPNAVNGVINILTKPAESTQGGLANAEGGSASQSVQSVRWGGALGNHAFYRTTARNATYDPLTTLGGLAPSRGWNHRSLAFRMDWNPDTSDQVSVSGQGTDSTQGHVFGPTTPSNPFPARQDALDRSFGGSTAVSWQHTFRNGSTLDTRGSFEHIDHGDLTLPLTYDDTQIEMKYHMALGSRQDVIWGVDYVGAGYRFGNGGPIKMNPPHSILNEYSTFLEDEISLLPDRLSFVAGAYVGHNPFSGLEVQPTGRLLWTPASNLAVWAAVSRAVSTPSLLTRGVDVYASAFPMPPLVGLVHLTGNPGYRSTPTLSYEAGQRMEIGRHLSLDASLFFTVYHRLDSQIPLAPALVPPGAGSPPYIEIPFVVDNARHGRSYGGELSATWKVASRWRLTGGYSWLNLATQPYSAASGALPSQGEAGSPRNQWTVRSYLDLTRRLEFDCALYFYGRMPEAHVPENLRGDARLAWRAGEHWELGAGVQDAFNPDQVEYYATRLQNSLTQVHRNAYAAITWKF